MSGKDIPKASIEEDEAIRSEKESGDEASTQASSRASILSVQRVSEVPSEIRRLSKSVTFDYSFSYDCRQPFNLCVADETTLVFYSGCLIHIFDVVDRKFTFKRSLNGSGIGHIAKNPMEDHLAVGEKCVNPLIIIYSWPNFEVVSKMSGGTTRAYSHLGYSPDGSMLVSQGKEPDHLITIWDWKEAHIILRVKSHGQDVFNAEFSQFVPGQLTSSGLGHIKFWKMAKTFTGLKLQGELGRFGKTEICDILGVCAMPDEKVISGSEWGNLLAWEDKLIKLEVRQKAKGNCHTAPISQIHYNPFAEDIISVGMDGWIKMWTRATIDAADPPDEEGWFLEMQPLLELEVKDELSQAKLMSICKKSSDPLDHDWFGQDADGGIWSLNLSPEGNAPERLFTCHSGAVADIAPSPIGYYVASLGSNGCLLIHDIVQMELLITKRFKAAGTSLLWMPIHVEASGAVLVGGFADGMVRMFVVSLREFQRARHSSSSCDPQLEFINMIQASTMKVKAHNAPVTVVSLNPRGSILVSGSEDRTFFIYQILPKREYIILIPIGFVELLAPISYITWRPHEKAAVVVACVDGTLHEVNLPERPCSINSATYSLQLYKESLFFKAAAVVACVDGTLQEVNLPERPCSINSATYSLQLYKESLLFVITEGSSKAAAVVACVDGTLQEVNLPERPCSINSATYSLQLYKESLFFVITEGSSGSRLRGRYLTRGEFARTSVLDQQRYRTRNHCCSLLQKAAALVGCVDGTLHEVNLPERPCSINSATYSLQPYKESLLFKSVKSELIRAEELRAIELKKQEKLERKRAELTKIKADNPNLDINEELYLMDSDEELEFPPLYYPEKPSPILFVIVLPNDNLLLSMGDYDCGYLYEYAFGVTGPVKSDPVPNALNIPIHCYTYLCDGQVLALGLDNGIVRLVHCEDGVADMTLYYDLPMHDTEQGAVRRLMTSNDGSYLYSCGTDGNIFSYSINRWGFLTPIASSLASRQGSIYVSASIPRDVVIDESGESEPSLEQTRTNAEKLLQLKLAEGRKEDVRQKLASLKNEFDYIIDRNSMLPASQILPHSTFELDERITAALRDKIAADMALTMRKLAFQVATARLLVKKMQNYFVDGIASLDVTVRAIKNEALRIKAFTHNKLTSAFLNAESGMSVLLDAKPVLSQMTLDTSSRGGSSIITMSRLSGVESMLKLQPYYSKLSLKARKAVIKSNMQRLKRERRQQQWQNFLELKPDINADDPEDVIKFEYALENIGDFKLKASDTYRVPEKKRVSPAQKYWQMLSLHKEIFQTKEAFNKKVCQVRDSKIALVRRFKQLYHDLDTIQKELSPDLRKERLPVPKCYLKEQLEFGADPQIYNPVSIPYDEEYFVLRVNHEKPAPTTISRTSLVYWNQSLTADELITLSDEDDKETPWEYEMRVLRMTRLLLEQDQIIKEMQDGVDHFDYMLEHLSIDRLRYARDIKVMEIYQLTLHQELIVINSYAGREQEITSRINTAVALRNDKLRQKFVIQDQIESKQSDVQLWQLKLADLQEEVTGKLANNRFITFLSRLFKKKRAVKRSEDSDSESSESDDESDEDYDDDEDENAIPLKLDDNVCPEGCDEDLYKDIVRSRVLKYDVEDCITELRKQLDEHQKELQVCNKELAKLEVVVQETKKELEILQFEKQQKLNDIESVVVLNLSQFRHFETPSLPEEGLVQNPLVFHNEILCTLAGRVNELEKETEQEQTKIRQLKALMQRLEARRKEMKKIKANMKKAIDGEILKKFGELIDVDDMEEAVLKKMVAQARTDYMVQQIRRKYDKIVAEEKTKLCDREDELLRVEKENTRRLRLQTMLEHEMIRLKDLMRVQSINKDKTITVEELETHDKDLKQMEEVLKDQLEVRSQLQGEIRQLRYKCTPPERRRPVANVLPEETKSPFLDSETLEKEEIEVSMDIDFDEVKAKRSPRLSTEDNEELEEKEAAGVEMPTETVVIIDNVLQRLASGSSAYDVAVSLVDDLLSFPGQGSAHRHPSAFDYALKLVEELVLITTKVDTGDVENVEYLAGDLLKIAQEEEENLDAVEFEDDITDG
ncbi:cilia- and flagella-associated protein 44-like [Homalodisca vitripennis]|uniref:cilia- and flagella-associated protein 44-like n=1 Tax=Homalodisca vitripennis TaxID=197043 RepID=UPI001EECDCDC|nr:cilia- and flagella-associated protein 44-like [Homalodisca vitripennis]